MPKEATKVAINLLDREYSVACGPGEERNLQEIVQFVDGKLHEIANKAEGVSESRLFMLTCLLLADELFELKRLSAQSARDHEDIMVAAVEHLSQRVASIATQVGRA